ncbi:MAG: YfhO family protein [Magnetococcales bacterium]|nr:hypothetical protein [Magnetococcales bacterium]NGZ27447.1 YfhO family protein [Magnetococcales bacterium]
MIKYFSLIKDASCQQKNLLCSLPPLFYLIIFSILLAWPYFLLGPYSIVDFYDQGDSLLPKAAAYAQLFDSYGVFYWDPILLGGLDRLGDSRSLFSYSAVLMWLFSPLLAYQIYMVLYYGGAVFTSFFLFRRLGAEPIFAAVLSYIYGVLFSGYYSIVAFESHFAFFPGFLLILDYLARKESEKRSGYFIAAFVAGLCYSFFLNIALLLPLAGIFLGFLFLVDGQLRNRYSWQILFLFLLAAALPHLPVVVQIFVNLSQSVHHVTSVSPTVSTMDYLMAGNLLEAKEAFLTSMRESYWALRSASLHLPALYRKSPTLYDFNFGLDILMAISLPLALFFTWRTGKGYSYLILFLIIIIISNASSFILQFLPSESSLRNFHISRLFYFVIFSQMLLLAKYLAPSVPPTPNGFTVQSYLPGIQFLFFTVLLISTVTGNLVHVVDKAIPMSLQRATQKDVLQHEELSQVAAQLKSQHRDPFRVATVARNLWPAIVHPYGLESLDGYTTIYPNRFVTFWNALISPSGRFTNSYYSYLFPRNNLLSAPYRLSDNLRLELLALANVRYLLVSGTVEESSLPELTSFQFPANDAINSPLKYVINTKKMENKRQTVHVYQIPQALPRAFGVFRHRIFPDTAAVAMALQNAPWQELRSTAFLESPALPAGFVLPDNDEARQGNVTILSYSPDKIILDVVFPQNGILVVTQNYHPKWKAWLDEQPFPIFPVYSTFQGTIVPQGNHRVVFHYQPWTW